MCRDAKEEMLKHLIYAVALAILGALALTSTASASATVVTTETAGEVQTPTIHAVNEGGHVSLANANSNIECASTVEATVEGHGEGGPVTGSISSLSFSNCTNGWTVTVNALGTLAVAWTSGHNGTASSSGATVTAVLHTIFGDITCRYATSSTSIGTVTGGNPATLDISASIPFHSGGGLCGSGNSQWSGSYVTTGALFVADFGMTVDPQELIFKKAGEELKVKILNKGTVPFKAVTVKLVENKEFELKKTCHEIKLAAGATCEETVKCKKENEKDELSAAALNVAITGAFVPLKC
jgi:hypothetical protein